MPSASVTLAESWEQTLANRIPLYGHRNWIVVADSAYPAQARAGIETIASNAAQVEVLRKVLAALAASKHMKPIIYTDQELKFVPEKDAPGIEDYRQQLSGLLTASDVKTLPHEQIIGKLDEAAQSFRVLIIKTNMTIPYTSVFLQLDCAYWNADAEARLRKACRSRK
jgi:D-ribose pyranose/furanose isomerase RbsD